MDNGFDRILDACLDRVRDGEDIDSVLASYPADSARLRPLLQAALQASRSYDFTPSADAKRASKQRFDSALVQLRESRRQKRSWFSRVALRPATWAAAATVVVALIVVYLGVRPVLSPGAPVVLPITPVASPNGNFSFLISDDVNAISDFNDVTVNIDKIGLQQTDSGKWIEITPEVSSVDLTKVPGALTQQIWRGNVLSGNYQQVFVYVANVTGTLKSTGERIEIKLPSQRLHLAVPFAVSDNTVTSFTYDMTVIRTGNGRNTNYILKPQISDSGANQVSRDSGDTGNPQKPTVPEQRPTSLPTPTKKTPKK